MCNVKNELNILQKSCDVYTACFLTNERPIVQHYAWKDQWTPQTLITRTNFKMHLPADTRENCHIIIDGSSWLENHVHDWFSMKFRCISTCFENHWPIHPKYTLFLPPENIRGQRKGALGTNELSQSISLLSEGSENMMIAVFCFNDITFETAEMRS